METDLDKTGVGQRVRGLRMERGLSLRELASRANVAASFLSKIEAGKASPTIMSLVKILEALDMDVATFFDGNQRQDPATKQVVFPRAGMRPLVEVDRTWWCVFPKRGDINLVMTYEEYKPRTRVAEVERHHTDVCGYVLDGQLTLELPGQGVVKADKGDAFYIRANQPHIARNTGARTLKLVVVQPKKPA